MGKSTSKVNIETGKVHTHTQYYTILHTILQGGIKEQYYTQYYAHSGVPYTVHSAPKAFLISLSFSSSLLKISYRQKILLKGLSVPSERFFI